MNTFSNIFKKSFLEGFGGSDITTVRILVTLAVTCALALYIFIVYYVATKKTFYSKTFNIALFMIAVITSSIILAMQSNLVISLGIICGAEMYKIGMIMSLVLTIGLFLLELTPVGKASVLLVVNAKDAQAEAGIMQIVGQYAKRPAVKSRNLSKDGMDLIIEIKTAQENKLLAELLAAQNVYGASLMAHDGEIM